MTHSGKNLFIAILTLCLIKGSFEQGCNKCYKKINNWNPQGPKLCDGANSIAALQTELNNIGNHDQGLLGEEFMGIMGMSISQFESSLINYSLFCLSCCQDYQRGSCEDKSQSQIQPNDQATCSSGKTIDWKQHYIPQLQKLLNLQSKNAVFDKVKEAALNAITKLSLGKKKNSKRRSNKKRNLKRSNKKRRVSKK